MTAREVHDRYTEKQLSGMDKAFYAGKCNDWQKNKFLCIQSELYSAAVSLYPLPEHQKESSLLHLWGVLGCYLDNHNRDEKNNIERIRANAHTAHQQLLNYDLQAKEKERAKR